jgi:hypothetical protein
MKIYIARNYILRPEQRLTGGVAVRARDGNTYNCLAAAEAVSIYKNAYITYGLAGPKQEKSNSFERGLLTGKEVYRKGEEGKASSKPGGRRRIYAHTQGYGSKRFVTIIATGRY